MVLPERTAPSQTMASFPLSRFPGTHQESTRFCFGEKAE
jgi:hypothetical protein